MEKEPKFEFKVWYKANPTYEGSHNRNLKKGLHGTFETILDAKEQAEKCRKFFSEENINTPKSVNGVMVDDYKVVPHDNVVVWIEQFKDGKEVVEEPKKKVA